MKKLKRIIKSFINVFKSKKIIPILNIIDNNKILSDKVAFITGGSGGIGYSIADKFIKSGCKVVISGTNEKKLKSISKSLGDNCKYICLDLNDTSIFSAKIKEVVSIFGRIDILVCSHGKHISKKELNFLNSTVDEYNEIMNLNLRGTYFLCQEVSKYMINNKIKGHILMISSQSALEPSWSPYRLSKFGLKGLTKGIAQQLIKYGIVVNSIGPGPTATNMQGFQEGDSIYTDQNPIYRYTMPSEVAEFAVMLVSSLGDTIVGETLYMSGGRGSIEIR